MKKLYNILISKGIPPDLQEAFQYYSNCDNLISTLFKNCTEFEVVTFKIEVVKAHVLSERRQKIFNKTGGFDSELTLELNTNSQFRDITYDDLCDYYNDIFSARIMVVEIIMF